MTGWSVTPGEFGDGLVGDTGEFSDGLVSDIGRVR